MMPTLSRRALLSTGSKALDSLLGGGVPVPCTLELVGPAGSGKTQLCHQLAVMVQLPPARGGLGAKALYVDTEGTFRPERIAEIAKYRGLDPEEALERIVYARARKWGELIDAVLGAPHVGVVIVDSLSRLFRGAATRAEAGVMVGRLASTAWLLLRLALERKVVAIYTSHAVGERAFGDPYVSLFSCLRVYLTPLGGGRLEAKVTGRGFVELVVTPEGVLGEKEGGSDAPRSHREADVLD